MLEVSLLGPVEVVVDGRRHRIGSRAQRVLLAALGLRAGTVVSADRLVELIWGEAPPPSASSSLHAQVSRLRKTVGATTSSLAPPDMRWRTPPPMSPASRSSPPRPVRRTWVATYLGDSKAMLEYGNEMLTLARRRGDATAETLALMNLCLGRLYSGDPEGAAEIAQEVRHHQQSFRSQTLEAWADYVEGEILLDRDPGRAVELLDRAVFVARRAGNRLVEGAAGLSAASVRARHGNPEPARERFDSTIRHWLEMGDWTHQWVTLRNLALLLERLGDPEGATVPGSGRPARTALLRRGGEAPRSSPQGSAITPG